MGIGAVVAIAYGILAAVGGIIGYRQAGSKPSLVSGLISGTLLIIGGVLNAIGQTGGYWLSLIVTILLIIVFAIRLVKTKKVMPAGVMLGAGVVTLIFLAQIS